MVIVGDSVRIAMIVENVAMRSMLAFVVGCVVASDLAYQHSNRVSIDVSIRCQFVVVGDFLFRRHFEHVPILAVYPMDHADPDEVTEIVTFWNVHYMVLYVQLKFDFEKSENVNGNRLTPPGRIKPSASAALFIH